VKHPPFFASPHVKEDGGERQNDHPGINPQGVQKKTARDHQSWDTTNLKMEGKHGKKYVFNRTGHKLFMIPTSARFVSHQKKDAYSAHVKLSELWALCRARRCFSFVRMMNNPCH
jgi:hypothetical protein